MERDEAVRFVRHVVESAPTGEPRMALVTGSIARGLADESSDLDVYLYWDHLDTAALGDAARFTPVADRAFGVPTATGWFSKLRLDGRYVDVEDVDAAVLPRASEALNGAQPPPGWAVKVAAGLRDAIAVDGDDELARWRRRLVFGDEAATADVAARLPRLLAPSALYELTYARGDVLSFAARLSQVLLDVVAVLGAVNRRFIPVDEPKWLPWHIGQLVHAPDELEVRVRAALSDPTPATVAALDEVVDETLDLVDVHVPNAPTHAARYATALRPRPPG